MRALIWAVVAVAVVVGDYYGFLLASTAMSYAKDYMFILGLLIAALLIVTNYILLERLYAELKGWWSKCE